MSFTPSPEQRGARGALHCLYVNTSYSASLNSQYISAQCKAQPNKTQSQCPMPGAPLCEPGLGDPLPGLFDLAAR